MEKRPKIIVSGVIKNADGNVLLIEEELESGKRKWIVPGGSVEFGETLEEALHREIGEETGLTITIDHLIGFKEALYPQFNYHTVIFFFAASTPSNHLQLESKASDGKFASPAEAATLSLVDTAEWVLHEIGFLPTEAEHPTNS